RGSGAPFRHAPQQSVGRRVPGRHGLSQDLRQPIAQEVERRPRKPALYTHRAVYWLSLRAAFYFVGRQWYFFSTEFFALWAKNSVEKKEKETLEQVRCDIW